MFANRISSSTNCSIWLPETSPPSSSRGVLRHRFESCNTSAEDLLLPDFRSGAAGLPGRSMREKASAPAATSAWLGREAKGAPVSQPTTLLHSGGGVKTQTQRLGDPGARFHVQNAQPITPSVLSIIATVVAVVSVLNSNSGGGWGLK